MSQHAPSDGPPSAAFRAAFPEWQLTSSGYRAVISAVGATVRQLTYRGRDLVVPFDAGAVRPFYRGALIAPWPNRIADGRYTFDGRDFQVPLNEVDRSHALHGLVHWNRWEAVEALPDSVVLRTAVVPQDGYPFAIDLLAEYMVASRGLTGRLTATNIGSSPAPYGCCPHPYLVAGTSPLDEWQLSMPAATRLEVDERLIPVGTRPVDDVDCDFRTPSVIGAREIDHAFADLVTDDGGSVAVQLLDPAHGTGVELSFGSWAPWVQIHTADRPEPVNNRVGLAVEPMNCPPNAFNAPQGPPVLESGATHVAQWTISAISTPAPTGGSG